MILFCYIVAVRTGMRIKFLWETDGNTSDGQSVNSDVSMRMLLQINKFVVRQIVNIFLFFSLNISFGYSKEPSQ